MPAARALRRRLARAVGGVALFVAGGVQAHSVPVLPSTCMLAPVTLAANGTTATVDAPSGTPPLRIVYDVENGTAQLSTDPVVPRSFVAGGIAGTFAPPPLFTATVLTSGDLLAAAVPLALSLDGTTRTVTVALTTGLAGVPGLVAEGSPIAADGTFTAVAVATGTGLPAPLADPLVVRMTCRADPVPDLDQFRLATETRLRSGRIRAGTVALRAAVRPGPSFTPDFAGRPAILRVRAGDATIAEAVLPNGLAAGAKRRFTGTAADGASTVRLRFVRRRLGVDEYRLDASLAGATLPAPASRRVAVDLVMDVGGLVSRAEARFRAVRRRTQLVLP
jgi:hypothetical protein